MRSIRFSKLFVVAATCAALAIAAAAPAHVSAQCTGIACTPVRADGKGMIGLGLLGGEIGLIIPAIVQNAAHTNEWWPYLVFPLIGIGAGIGGGYALEQATQNTPEIDIGIMIGAMVLIVPTIIGTLALASYTPPSEAADPDEDMADTGSPASGDSVEAVQDGSSSSAAPADTSSSSSDSSTASPPASSSGTSSGTSLIGSTPRDAVAGGPGMIRFDGDGNRVLLGVPMLGALARYTPEEIASLHMQQQYDLNVPVFSGSF